MSSDNERAFPQELDRFNWGAAFVPMLWYAFHGAPGISVAFFLGALLFMPTLEFLPAAIAGLLRSLILFGASAFVAKRANRIAWRTSPYELSVGRYLEAQRQWAIGGGVAALLVVAWVTVGNLLIP